MRRPGNKDQSLTVADVSTVQEATEIIELACADLETLARAFEAVTEAITQVAPHDTAELGSASAGEFTFH